ncbi:hypothetical protein BCR33DRAFT_715294 [Rhizoclosmatium globosum]|uniref:Uncharacterized protein n=1 Tax=Rhizoclosmatium globosum TaxID=329046 RepID=A0A1Y2CIP0_9FUNG|nr:hypothetical protein BCR33DRAFT_715294 [Rhizoclosmatium globosum]|eukprot:ORY46882.1 hypothetical protein BCR33DRAFT_715294 [Rhizoclosmatium globosum]
MAFGEESTSLKGPGFATASNTMDTEKKMQEFIERELKKRLSGEGRADSNDSLDKDKDSDKSLNDTDASKPVVEGNVAFSAAMLTSIPVVDLGVAPKARRDMMLGKLAADDGNKLSSAMNVSASNRFYRGQPSNVKGTQSAESKNGDQKFDRRTMATDDLVMQNFKKRNLPGNKRK